MSEDGVIMEIVVHKATEKLGLIKSVCGDAGYSLAEKWENVECVKCLKFMKDWPIVPKTSCVIKSIVTDNGYDIRTIVNTHGRKETTLRIDDSNQKYRYVDLILTKYDLSKLVCLLLEANAVGISNEDKQ